MTRRMLITVPRTLLLITLQAMALLLQAGTAGAGTARAASIGNPPSAGVKGTATAWDESGAQVIGHRFCVKQARSWDYAGCGQALSAEVGRQLCAAQGRGEHVYLLQLGDAAPVRRTQRCEAKE